MFTETPGLDPDQQDPYAASQVAVATYRMVDVFTKLSGLATTTRTMAGRLARRLSSPSPSPSPSPSQPLALHKALSGPDIPEDERAGVHLEALVECFRQWMTEIPPGLTDGVRDP